MKIEDKSINNYIKDIKRYIKTTKKVEGCIGISVKQITENNTCTLFEIWESEIQYKSHLSSSIYKEHFKLNIDHLISPEGIIFIFNLYIICFK